MSTNSTIRSNAAHPRHGRHHRYGITNRLRSHRRRRTVTVATVLAVVGPGLLAGLSDDDPAGITTYSLLGARFGTSLLWSLTIATIVLVLFHLMALRLGVATGRGFTAEIRHSHGARWASVFATGLVVANVGTIAAEYAGIASVAQLIGIAPWLLVVPAVAALCWLLVSASFHRIERLLMVVAALLAAYVPAALLSHASWSTTLHDAMVPGGLRHSGAAVAVAACIGTTLAPWGLAFIQSYAVDKGLTSTDIAVERIDVVAGSLLTGIIGACVVVTCAATLHVHHVAVRTVDQVADALRPLAGSHATVLFGAGLLGAALLAAAIVPLSTAYSVGEARGWRTSLDGTARGERGFYATLIGLSMAAGALVLTPGINMVTVMYASQVVNAVLLVPHLIMLTLLTRSPQRMGNLASPPWLQLAAAAATTAVTACLIYMVVGT